jgi:hypothetical protein
MIRATRGKYGDQKMAAGGAHPAAALAHACGGWRQERRASARRNRRLENTKVDPLRGGRDTAARAPAAVSPPRKCADGWTI